MIYNIHKPLGWTSFDVVKKIRNITGERKVGHGGTLDPFAEGVLIVGTGKDTKLLQSVSAADKTYEATLKLGELTDTLDNEGVIIETAPLPILDKDQIVTALNKFSGKQEQIPPMFSAKKVNGVRLYKLARQKKVVERKPIVIIIYSINLISVNLPEISFSVTCSKGTYIRVLGKDIAEKLGTVGHLTALVRTRVGGYPISQSKTIEVFQEEWISTTV